MVDNNKQAITVVAFIYKKIDGRSYVLLARRAKTKQFLPNIFELVGGHVEYGESVPDALEREVFEELHISLSIEQPFSVFTFLDKVQQAHTVEIVYFARISPDQEKRIRLNPEDHSAFEWFTKEDILRRNSEIITPSDSDDIEHEDLVDSKHQVLMQGFDLLEEKQASNLH